jgi:hypothetical protein
MSPYFAKIPCRNMQNVRDKRDKPPKDAVEPLCVKGVMGEGGSFLRDVGIRRPIFSGAA